jgi:GT2 family glycosyltransferase
MKFSIIIPHRNGLQYLSACVASVRKHTKNYQLIIVDDCSTDDSEEWIKSECTLHDNTTAIFLNEHQGFASAVNAGLADARGDFIILLNNDTIVTPEWAESMVRSIGTASLKMNLKNIGFVGPVSNYAGGLQGIPTDPYTLDQLDSGAIEHRKAFKDHIVFFNFVSGFCMLITKECLKAVGLFDEQYNPGLWEDNDWCLRATLLGFQGIIDQST